MVLIGGETKVERGCWIEQKTKSKKKTSPLSVGCIWFCYNGIFTCVRNYPKMTIVFDKILQQKIDRFFKSSWH